MTLPLEGLLLVDKPEGPTSHDVVARIRRVASLRRVGHAGTLDPMATGLLPLVLGRATRLVRFLPHSPKRYEGSFELGLTTTTDDRTGELVARHGGPLPGGTAVRAAAGRFRGNLPQVPPAVSAKKVDGVRLYRLARRGKAVAPSPVNVEISRFEVNPTEEPATWTFLAEVSAGTYIRALVRDLGQALGCGAVLASLRRTAIGPLGLAGAIPLPSGESPEPETIRDALIPIERMPLDLEKVTLTEAAQAERFLAGAPVPFAGLRAGVEVRVHDRRGALLGVGEADEASIRPRVVLPAPSPDSRIAGGETL